MVLFLEHESQLIMSYALRNLFYNYKTKRPSEFILLRR